MRGASPVAEDLAAEIRLREALVGDAAEDRLARVARRPVAEHVSPHDGVEPVGADQEIAFERAAVLEDGAHERAVRLDARVARPRLHGLRRHARRECGMERTAVEHVPGPAGVREEAREAQLREVGAAPRRHAEASERRAALVERSVDAERLERAHRAGQDAETRADLAELARLLEHDEREPEALERGREREAADPGADDDRALRLHGSPRRQAPDA